MNPTTTYEDGSAQVVSAPQPVQDLTARAVDLVADVGTRVGAELGADLGKELRESALLLALALVVVGLVALLASTALLLG